MACVLLVLLAIAIMGGRRALLWAIHRVYPHRHSSASVIKPAGTACIIPVVGWLVYAGAFLEWLMEKTVKSPDWLHGHYASHCWFS